MVVRNVNLNDIIAPNVSQREITVEGYMRVPGRAARSGIQTYSASELGILGSSKDIWRVYRPPKEVFSKASLETYGGADVTLGHPPYNLDPNTFRDYTAGSIVSPGVEDDGYVKVDLLIKDKKTIEAINSGTMQLSAGYVSQMDDNVPEGADYDLIQSDIQINHVAVVPNARAGAGARLADSEEQTRDEDEEKGMSVKDNKFYYFEDNNVNSKLDATIEGINTLSEKLDAFKDVTEEEEEEEKKKKKLQPEKNDATEEEEEEEKKKKKLQSMKNDATEEEEEEEKKKKEAEKIKDAVLTRDAARLIVGDSCEIFSTDAHETRLQVLRLQTPNRDWQAESPEYIRAAFDILAGIKSDNNKSGDNVDGFSKLHPSALNLAKGIADSVMPKLNLDRTPAQEKYLADWAARGDA